MIERRRHKRNRSPHRLPILHQKTNKQLGVLVDLSFGGLLMMTMLNFEIGRIYPLRIIVPQTEGNPKNIEFSAEVSWVDVADQNGMFWTGFQAIDMPKRELEKIRRLVELWSVEEDLAFKEEK